VRPAPVRSAAARSAAVSALSVRLRAHLAVKASETVKIDSVPDYVDPADPTRGRFKHTDTLTAVAMIVTF